MYCGHCGKENTDDAKFCVYCGASLQEEASGKSTGSRAQEQTFWKLLENEIKAVRNHGTSFCKEEPIIPDDKQCPNCGSFNIHMVQKNMTDIKSSGYNLGNGCCGLCLLGPFGLLCGLLGTKSKVKVTNETWWMCNECGKEHISQASALEKAENFIGTLWGNVLLLGVIGSLFFYWGLGPNLLSFLLVIGISIIVPLAFTAINYDMLSKELGYSIIDILSMEKRQHYRKAVLQDIGILAAAIIFFVPILQAFL